MKDILILHGWGWPISSPQWSKVKTLLENRDYRVFVPDLPGFGKTPQPPKPWTIDDYAEWTRGFCEKNNLSQFFLLGHSFGGSLATKFAIRYPEKVKKMILVDSAGIRKKRLKKEIQKAVAHFLNKFSFLQFYPQLKKFAYKTIFRRSDYLLTEGIMKETYLNVINDDISESFSKVSVPTLLIWGKNDKITPLWHAYFIKEKVAGAELQIMPGIKHNPHFESPEALAEKIIEFLR